MGAGPLSLSPSPSQSTGVGMVASTTNGPATRVTLLSSSGRSTSTSMVGGSLLAMLLSVMCGTSPPTSSPRLFCLRWYTKPPAGPRDASLSVYHGKVAVSSRCRASASGTRDVSMVIQRRPHCSATYAVVPEPQVGSRTRSPGSVVIRRQRWMTFTLVWTTYALSRASKPHFVSSQTLPISETAKSSMYRMYESDLSRCMTRRAATRRCIPSIVVFQFASLPGWKDLPSN